MRDCGTVVGVISAVCFRATVVLVLFCFVLGSWGLWGLAFCGLRL